MGYIVVPSSCGLRILPVVPPWSLWLCVILFLFTRSHKDHGEGRFSWLQGLGPHGGLPSSTRDRSTYSDWMGYIVVSSSCGLRILPVVPPCSLWLCVILFLFTRSHKEHGEGRSFWLQGLGPHGGLPFSTRDRSTYSDWMGYIVVPSSCGLRIPPVAPPCSLWLCVILFLFTRSHKEHGEGRSFWLQGLGPHGGLPSSTSDRSTYSDS